MSARTRGASIGIRVGAMLTGLLLAGAALADATDPGTRLGLPWDWSHRHVVITNPETAEEARDHGTYVQWLDKARDPRFLAQVVRKMDARAASLAGPVAKAAAKKPAARKSTRGKKSPASHSDDFGNR